MKIMLQVQGDQYFPEVKNKALFAYVGQRNNHAKQHANIRDNEGSIKDCLDAIELENKRLLTIYKQSFKALESMVTAKEISKKNLIELFIKFFPKNSVTIAGERFLSSWNQTNKKPLPMQWAQGTTQQEINSLIHTLSVWVATNQIDSDALFEYIEKK